MTTLFDKQDHTEREHMNRDVALALLEDYREDKIEMCYQIARRIAREEGKVSSTDVLLFVKKNDLLNGSDARLLGPVFRRAGWKAIGWENSGSHGRPVKVWTWVGA